MLDRVAQLHHAGLLSTMVVEDFLHRCLAPLRARVRSTWFYTGDDDTTRTCQGTGTNLSKVEIAELLMLIVEVQDLAMAILSEGVVPLCDDPARHALLSTLSVIDACGLVPVRLTTPPISFALKRGQSGLQERQRPEVNRSTGGLLLQSPRAPPALGYRMSSVVVVRPSRAPAGCLPPPPGPSARGRGWPWWPRRHGGSTWGPGAGSVLPSSSSLLFFYTASSQGCQ